MGFALKVCQYLPICILIFILSSCSAKRGLVYGVSVSTAEDARKAFESSSARSINRLITPGQTLNLTESEPLLLGGGWCASTREILDQNDLMMETKLFVEDVQIDPILYASRDYGSDDPDNPTFCRSYYVLLESWPEGKTCIEVDIEILEPLSDGWDDYDRGIVAVPYCVFLATL
jgi:hypothetical protein